MRKLSLFAFVIFFCNSLSAQPPQMKFNYIGTDEGLSTNRATCFYRDSKGYLWIGTEGGLNRYDGYQIKIFYNNEKQPGTISNNGIECIYEDRGNNLWCGTFDGLNLYDPATESFKVFRNDSTDKYSLNNNHINSIIEDKKGNLWIVAGGNCLNKWIPKNQNFIRYEFQKKQEIYIPSVRIMTIDSKGFFWIVTTNRGICRFDPETGNNIIYDDPSIDFGNNFVKCLCIDKKDKIWIGSIGGDFYSFNTETSKFEHYGTSGQHKGLNGNLVHDIIEEDDRYLLIAVDQGGINRFDKVTKTFEYIMYDAKNKQGLNNDGVWSLYKDKEGILWVGTSGGGINYYNPKQNRFRLFKHIPDDPQSLSYDVIGCFYEDTHGMIWIGTDGGGMSVYNPKTGIFKNYKYDPSDPYSISGNFIRCIAEDKDHDMWIGTWNSGVNRFERKTGRFHHYLPDKNNPASVRSRIAWHLIVDHFGKIWICNWDNGIEVLDPKKGVIKRFGPNPDKPGSLSNNTTWFLYEDDQGNIWICADDALNRYDRIHNSFTVYKNFPDNHIRVICKDKRGNLWAGSVSKGLFLFKPDGTVVKTYDKTSGLPDNAIYAIVEDNQGNLWITTNNGISQFNQETQKFRNYTKSDGLQGDQFFQQSFLKTRNGEIYFGGFKGFNSFSPESLKDNDYIPPVYITDFQIFNKPVVYGGPGSQFQTHISEAKEIDLSWDQSVFSFEFAAINFTHPGKNQYSYIMEGFEKEWNSTNASRRYATYTNLDPGTYTFKVKASNNDGVWNEEGTSIRITILPPFWQTLWFRFILLGVISGTAYLIYKWRVQMRDFAAEKRMEAALTKERTLLRMVIDNLPDAIYAKDIECRKTLANTADFRNMGLESEAQVLGKNDYELFPKEFADGFIADDRSVIQTGQPVLNREEYVIDAERQKHWLLTSKLPLRDQKGQIIGLLGIGRDITERKRLEEDLRQERMLLRLVIDNLPDAIYAKDIECRKTLTNTADFRNMGLESEAQVLGKNDYELFPKEIADGFIADDRSVIQTGQPVLNREEYLIDPEGQKRWLLTTKLPLRDKQGQIVGLVGIGRDITRRKHDEETLQESEKRFRELYDDAPVGYHELDAEGRYVRVNKTELKMLGYTAEEMIGQHAWKFASNEEESKQRTLPKLTGTVLPTQGATLVFHRKDGSELPVLLEERLLMDAAGTITGIRTTVQDITELKRVEDALAQKHNLLQTLIDLIPDYIYVKDIESRFILANIALLQSFGKKSLEEIFGKTDLDFHVPEAAREYFADEQEIIRSGRPLIDKEEYVREYSGQYKWAISTKIPLRDHQGNIVGLVGTGRDITKRKLAEEELRKSEENFKRMASNIEDVIYSVDADTMEYRYLSPAFERILGYTADDIAAMGGRRSFLSKIILEEKYMRHDQILGDIRTHQRNTGADYYEAWWRCKDGSVKCLEDHWIPVFHEGRLVSTDGILRDITKWKEADEELHKSEENFQRMASRIDEVLYSIDVDRKEFRYLSPVFERIFSYTIHNIEQMGGLREFLLVVTPDQVFGPLHENIDSPMRERTRDASHHQTTWWRCKDGSLKYVENRWFTLYEGNRLVRIDGVLRDMTEQQRLEEQRRSFEEKLKTRNVELEQMLTDLQEMQGNAIRAENLAAVSRITTGIAREIDMPLTHLTDVLKQPEFDSAMKGSPQILVQITDEIEKIKSVIDRLHTILHTDGSEGTDLLNILNEAFSISSQESKPKITVLKK